MLFEHYPLSGVAQPIRGEPSLPRRSTAMADLNYTVPGIKFVYAQPTTMVCWATVCAMMKAWKRGTGFPQIRGAIVPLGTPWITYFDTNTAIPPAQGQNFQTSVGLMQEARGNPSPEE